MDTRFLELGSAFAAITLIGWAVLSFLDGSASATGVVIRESLRDVLGGVRSSSSLTRAELAEVTIFGATLIAIAGAIAQVSVMLAAVAVILALGRRSITRHMSQENRLMAVAGHFTSDLMIGVFVPLLLAQLLTGHFYLGTVLGLVIVALSWPAGGARSTGRWRPAWHSA